jgi:hypothetical protein
MRVPEGVNRFLIGAAPPEEPTRHRAILCVSGGISLRRVDSRRKSVTEEIVFLRTVTGRLSILRSSSILGLVESGFRFLDSRLRPAT